MERPPKLQTYMTRVIHSGRPTARCASSGSWCTRSELQIVSAAIAPQARSRSFEIGRSFPGRQWSILWPTERMCTLTFIPTEDGYLVAMNRDELRSRPPALLPDVFEKHGVEMTYPRERSGGTWIACNGHGNLLALLNWNGSGSRKSGAKRRT